jgi:hypothetical protein
MPNSSATHSYDDIPDFGFLYDSVPGAPFRRFVHRFDMRWYV